MENSKKIILIGSVVLFSTSLMMSDHVSAEGPIYNPVDPNQRVEPLAPSQKETTESSVEKAVVETEPSETEEKPVQAEKPTQKKTMKRKKRYLTDSFFSNESNQFFTMNGDDTGGDGSSHKQELTETLQVLSGVALYGRKK